MTAEEETLPEELAPEESVYETDYQTGQDNIKFLGLDIHNPVFFMSAGLILSFAIITLTFSSTSGEFLTAARDWTLKRFDWFFVVATNIVFLFCLFVGLSSFGKIRLGGPDAKPEFGTLSWLSMLFSAGVGIGMVFYGAAEPTAYYTDWFGTPLDVEPRSAEAERLAFSATIFHWGVTPWAIYAVVGLSLAFFTFNKGLPLTIRSTFYPLLGERVWGWPGHLIDLLAVVATLFGLATSLGLGAKQAASGLHFLFGIDNGLATQVILIASITAMAIFSVVRGLDGGVRVLSNVNIVLALLLLAYVILAGPTLGILQSYGVNAFSYVTDSLRLSNWIGREDTEWFHGWTIFYWAWWISWSPFVGMFIARVSRGRTIREFLAAVLVMPVIVAVIWFSSFGYTAIDQVKSGVGSLSGGVSEVSLVLFQMLENLPFAEISSLVAIILLIVFFVTSSDSGSLVIDSITAGGKLHAPIPQRVFWATMEGLVAIVLLVGGGSAALTALQAGAITTGLPFTLVLLACCVSLWRGLASETPVSD
ncbi:BCCT family transporter [Hyphococcus flavus]|uniref:BCCT family transporter n=1 Tax=Hyphococcus flavus TaxID=1866326 RepID=A0AAF0CG01_9PROT|nr:BCCT family transporter [Hyphococcus flavus]WDI30147.1 BCCT family transporter [Hyphococcus flavus]